jgi:hypothetical protein
MKFYNEAKCNLLVLLEHIKHKKTNFEVRLITSSKYNFAIPQTTQLLRNCTGFISECDAPGSS